MKDIRLEHPCTAQPPVCSHTTQDPTLMTSRDRAGSQYLAQDRDFPTPTPKRGSHFCHGGNSLLYASGGIACGCPAVRWAWWQMGGSCLPRREAILYKFNRWECCVLWWTCAQHAECVGCDVSDGFCTCDISTLYGCCAACVVHCMFGMSGACVCVHVCETCGMHCGMCHACDGQWVRCVSWMLGHLQSLVGPVCPYCYP